MSFYSDRLSQFFMRKASERGIKLRRNAGGTCFLFNSFLMYFVYYFICFIHSFLVVAAFVYSQYHTELNREQNENHMEKLSKNYLFRTRIVYECLRVSWQLLWAFVQDQLLCFSVLPDRVKCTVRKDHHP